MTEPVRHTRVAYTRVAYSPGDRRELIRRLLAIRPDLVSWQIERALAILAPPLAREPLYEMQPAATPFARHYLNSPVRGQTAAPAPESQGPDLRKRATPGEASERCHGPTLSDVLANPHLVSVETR